MHLHLLVPGLIWPNPAVSDLTAGIALPGLARLLGMGHVETGPGESMLQCLARLFSLEQQQWSAALARRCGEQDFDPGRFEQRHWLCADPVNLQFAREHLVLSDIPADELSRDEIDALAHTINTFLQEHEEDRIALECPAPQRWYLRMRQPVLTRFSPLQDVIGRPVGLFLPEGEDRRVWQRLANEFQVLLHQHPVNQAREAAGRATVNALWLWGGGPVRATPQCQGSPVISSDPMARGLARLAGCSTAEPAGCPAHFPDQETLAVLDDLHGASLRLALDEWQHALRILERDWFAPALELLRRGTLTQLRLTAPGDRASLCLSVKRSDRLRFWRSPLPLNHVLNQLNP